MTMSRLIIKSLGFCQLLSLSAALVPAAEPLPQISAKSAVQVAQNYGPPAPLPSGPPAPGPVAAPDAAVPFNASNYYGGYGGYSAGGPYGTPGGYEPRI